MSTPFDDLPIVYPWDVADSYRIPPHDLDACSACQGSGELLDGEYHPSDPASASTHTCNRCGGSGTEPGW